MSYYRFITRNSASQANELGGLAFEDDAVACEFGTKIVLDLIEDDPTTHAGWTLEIAEGNRVVASIPFELDYLGD